MPDIKYQLPKRIKPLIDDESRDISVVAHRRWGKTYAGINRCLFGTKNRAGALTHPKTQYKIIYPTREQARTMVWPNLRAICEPLRGKCNDTDMRVEFPNGSVIRVRGGNYPDSLRGSGDDGAQLDEWAYFSDPSIYTSIVLPSLADRQGWSFKSSTYQGKNHAYVDHQTAERSYTFPASTSGVLKPDELKRLKALMAPEEYAQELDCEPLSYKGQIFTEFDRARNVIERGNEPEIGKLWTRIIGLDWGLSHNTAITFCAVDYDGNFYVYDEYVSNDKPAEHYIDVINAKMVGLKYDLYLPPDTMAKDQFRDGVRFSVFDQFAEKLRPIIANNQVSGGISLIKQMLITGKLKIFARCEQLIAGMERYRWADGDKERPVMIKDDEVCALRYGVATHFMSPIKSPEPLKANTVDFFRAISRPMANQRVGV